MTNEIRLDGCKPVPLASYLKALGILRLVAEQADKDVKGWWRDERFHLKTKLSREGLASFFLNDYAPSPIIAPWNGGSGFYPKDNTAGIKPIEQGDAPRFCKIKSAIQLGRFTVQKLGFQQSPKDDDKHDMIASIRSAAEDELLPWIDAAVAMTTVRLAFPALLGTGGNDGRLDFTNNYFQRLVELFDPATGKPRASDSLFCAAAFGDVVTGVKNAAIGQFAPAEAGGPNSTSGFEGAAGVNPWNFVLMLEGALLTASGVVRRFASEDRSAASFPFAVGAAAAGSGSNSSIEESDARGEFWAPLWNSASGADEVLALFREGRIAQTRRSLQDGVDAALAIGAVGADRRVAAFQRFGFQQRQGLAFLATPLRRHTVHLAPSAQLATDLGMRGWLERVRRQGRSDRTPAQLVAAVRQLEDGLIDLSADSDTALPAQQAIIAIGRIARIAGASNKLREAIAPPPFLRRDWIVACGDSAEVRLASALAGLWLDQRITNREGAQERGGDETDGVYAQQTKKDAYRFRNHITPLAPRGHKDWPAWTDSGASAETVWTEGALVDSLIALALRRSVLATQTLAGGGAFAGAPARSARLADVAGFLACDLDDALIGDLALGFAWVGAKGDLPPTKPSDKASKKNDAPALPLAYTAIKPIFAAPLRNTKPGKDPPPVRSTPKFVPTIAPLLAGGGATEAFRAAIRRAQADGLATPFHDAEITGINARRILAALMFPISGAGLTSCLDRAYPEDLDDHQNERADSDAA